MVEPEHAGPALQGTEGHGPSSERADPGVVRRTERTVLVSLRDDGNSRQAVRALAGRAVELVRYPGPVLAGPLVDGETLGTGRVEAQVHVRDVIGFLWRR